MCVCVFIGCAQKTRSAFEDRLLRAVEMRDESSRFCGEERTMWPKNVQKCKLRKIFKMRCSAKKRKDAAAAAPIEPPVSDNMVHEICDVLNISFDEETGEAPGTPTINSETGETELNCTQPEVKRPFKIPNAYAQHTEESKCLKDVGEIGGAKKFIANSETSKTPLLLFLLPTIFFFFPIVAVPLSIIEVALHTWAHKKNKKLRDRDIYYQSPMHVFVSEFCAACRFETSKNKITKIQDIRNKQNRMSFDGGIECVRNIV